VRDGLRFDSGTNLLEIHTDLTTASDGEQGQSPRMRNAKTQIASIPHAREAGLTILGVAKLKVPRVDMQIPTEDHSEQSSTIDELLPVFIEMKSRGPVNFVWSEGAKQIPHSRSDACQGSAPDIDPIVW
jgi:hypothetical protein